jgi:hypothetical protein
LPDAVTRGYQAAEVVDHADVTGLILAVVSRQLQKFLPGLDKLGLRGLPPAVAAARYHDLSNALGAMAWRLRRRVARPPGQRATRPGIRPSSWS